VAMGGEGLYPGLRGEETDPVRRWLCLDVSAWCRYSKACEGVGINCCAPGSLVCEEVY
jgi:hypothetical protein